MIRYLRILSRGLLIFEVLALLLATGCNTILPSLQGTVSISPTSAPTATSTATTTPPSLPLDTPQSTVTLTLWLPPQFDPEADTAAAKLLQERLDEFAARRPGIHLEVRIKSDEGSGGLLDALATASAAAPLTLPDVIALPRPLLEVAAIKGLLHPIDDISVLMDNPDWYTYARHLGRIQDSTFGLPFAADALVMVYRTTTITTPPDTFSATLTVPGPIAFPAADPQALFTLAMYQAAGGEVLDEQGRPKLSVAELTEVFNYFHQAAEAEIMPFWLTQYQTDAQVWEAFKNNQAVMAVTWMSHYLTNMQADILAAQLPTPEGEPHTLATGWVWALAGGNPEHQQLSIELAEFLTESAFLARWTSAMGYLPPRPSALEGWRSASIQTLAERIEIYAVLIPPSDVLTTIAQPLEAATVEVLKLQVDPVEAALSAAEDFTQP